MNEINQNTWDVTWISLLWILMLVFFLQTPIHSSSAPLGSQAAAIAPNGQDVAVTPDLGEGSRGALRRFQQCAVCRFLKPNVPAPAKVLDTSSEKVKPKTAEWLATGLGMFLQGSPLVPQKSHGKRLAVARTHGGKKTCPC